MMAHFNFTCSFIIVGKKNANLFLQGLIKHVATKNSLAVFWVWKIPTHTVDTDVTNKLFSFAAYIHFFSFYYKCLQACENFYMFHKVGIHSFIVS